MRSPLDTKTTRLHIGEDGTLRVPSQLVSAAQLRTGDEVVVRVSPKQLALVGNATPVVEASRQTQIAKVVRKALEQTKRADAHLARMPMMDEPAPEENLQYPLDTVVEPRRIPNVHRLQKKR